MFLRRIIVQDFKNISSADISFSPKINCICGNNGEGKTNLLDAVHYLSMTKSFLSVNDRYTYTYGKDEAVLHGTFQDAGQEEDIAVSVRSDGAKTVRRNGKAYKRLSEHVGRIPVVMTAPPDISLIHDSGEERRRFLNMMISQMDREYLRSVSAYNNLLKQRNAALRQEGTPDLFLETISERMYAPAAYIHARRREAAEQLAARAAEYYGFISGGREGMTRLLFIGNQPIDIGRIQIAIADDHRSGGKICLDCFLDGFRLVDGAHQDCSVNLALAEHLDGTRLLLFRNAGVVDEAGISLFGQFAFNIVDAICMMCRANIRDENTDHARRLVDQAARRFVWYVVILLQKLQHTRTSGLFDVWIVVDDPGNRAGRYAGHLSNVVNGHFLQNPFSSRLGLKPLSYLIV